MFGVEHPAPAHRLPGGGPLHPRLRVAWACTASCSAAGPPAPRTRCSASVRSTAQVISYELAMGLSLVSVFILAGSMSTSQIVDVADRDLVVPARCCRRSSSTSSRWSARPTACRSTSPRPRASWSSGYMTEYSSMKFAWFFLAEYINMLNVSAVATTLFLGGWRAPWPISRDQRRHVQRGLVAGPVVPRQALGCSCSSSCGSAARVLRFRYDQFMKIGWKVLIPAALVWVVASSAWSRACGSSPACELRTGAVRARRRRGLVAARDLVPDPREEAAARRRSDHPVRRCTTRSPAATPCRRCPARCCRRRRASSAPQPAAARRHAEPTTARSPRRCTVADQRKPAVRQAAARSRAGEADQPAPGQGRRAAHARRRGRRARPRATVAHRAARRRRGVRSPRSAGSASRCRTCSGRRSPSSTRRRRCRPSPGTTGATSSTGTPTAWRSASAASCAPGRAPRTRSTSRARTTPPTTQHSPGERYGRVYQINYLRCIFCGLCIEACPTRALTMTNEYELAGPTRAGMIWEKQDLLAPLRSGHARRRRTRWSRARRTPTTTAARSRLDAGAGRVGRASTGPTTRRCPAAPGSTRRTCPARRRPSMAATVAAATKQGTR